MTKLYYYSLLLLTTRYMREPCICTTHRPWLDAGRECRLLALAAS